MDIKILLGSTFCILLLLLRIACFVTYTPTNVAVVVDDIIWQNQSSAIVCVSSPDINTFCKPYSKEKIALDNITFKKNIMIDVVIPAPVWIKTLLVVISVLLLFNLILIYRFFNNKLNKD